MNLKILFINCHEFIKSQYRKTKYGYDYRNYKLAWLSSSGKEYRKKMLVEDSADKNLKPSKLEFFDKINLSIEQKTRILDVGAGFGRMLQWFEEYKFVDAIGLDISMELINENVSRAPIYQIDITKNLTDQDFSISSSFDIIYSRGVFMYFSMEQSKAAFANILNMLSPSGKYYCYEWKEELKRLELLKNDERVIFCELPKKTKN
jgi:cyclopropane fatty-acyl-phospholipid synthase-like methyltransferase